MINFGERSFEQKITAVADDPIWKTKISISDETPDHRSFDPEIWEDRIDGSLRSAPFSAKVDDLEH